MRAIALFLLGACATQSHVTFAISLTSHRANTAIVINGAMVDAGGDAPRALTVKYQFDDWGMAMNAHYQVQAFAGGALVGELAVTPMGCADGDTETAAVDLHTDGTFALFGDSCM
ncbi:MAG TPA: hypothetical protein VL463_27150 [Kofleriaceae bacterium]|jgi:hypothetical protein|nr:hypothetical protein [Kofleriaceae bacterium]